MLIIITLRINFQLSNTTRIFAPSRSYYHSITAITGTKSQHFVNELIRIFSFYLTVRWRLRRDEIQTYNSDNQILQIPQVNKIQISMDLKLRSDNDDYVFD